MNQFLFFSSLGVGPTRGELLAELMDELLLAVVRLNWSNHRKKRKRRKEDDREDRLPDPQSGYNLHLADFGSVVAACRMKEILYSE